MKQDNGALTKKQKEALDTLLKAASFLGWNHLSMQGAPESNVNGIILGTESYVDLVASSLEKLKKIEKAQKPAISLSL